MILKKIRIQLKLNPCDWVSDHPLDIEHHDKEWGNAKNLDNDQYLFEMLILESAQAGLSCSLF